MAFNYRPKTAKEVRDKKKPFSNTAASVFDFVKSQYGETIVLDPTSNFKSIKVPRAVQQKRSIIELKRELINIAKIDISSMDIVFGNGSGAGGSTINAAETAKQENATRLVCEHFIEKGTMPPATEIEKIYEGYDDGWANTFEMQAKALKTWLKANKGYEYSRDSGIMPYLENIALKKCGVKTKDSWNPADIYIVRKTKLADIKAKLKRIGDRIADPRLKLDALNDYMKVLFNDRDLVGISLKKLGKSVAVEETNVKGIVFEKITMIKNSLRCNLDLKANGEFETGELAFALKVGKNIVNVQVRAFCGGIRGSTQMDMTGSGAAAKLGKVSSREAIDPFLQKYGLKRRMATEIPKVGYFTNAEVANFTEEQRKLSTYLIAGMKVDFGKQNWKRTFAEARRNEIENNRTASQLSAKLQCFQWINILYTLDKKGVLNEFLNIAYYGAKKQYATAGPFLKIS